jgi:hypothetical protein
MAKKIEVKKATIKKVVAKRENIKVEEPKVELYNGIEIISKEDKGDATLLNLADGTTTIVENKYL